VLPDLWNPIAGVLKSELWVFLMGTEIHILTITRHNILHIAGDAFKCELILSKISREGFCSPFAQRKLPTISEVVALGLSLPYKKNPNSLKIDTNCL